MVISLKNAKIEVKNIKDAFVKADPANKDYYEKNYNEYVAKLDAMIKKYEDQFAKAPHKNFVTGHAAFAYLCRDFGLEQNSVEDVFAEGEPNAAQLGLNSSNIVKKTILLLSLQKKWLAQKFLKRWQAKLVLR